MSEIEELKKRNRELEMENEILRQFSSSGEEVKTYRFIEQERKNHPFRLLCRVMKERGPNRLTFCFPIRKRAVRFVLFNRSKKRSRRKVHIPGSAIKNQSIDYRLVGFFYKVVTERVKILSKT